MSKLKVKFKNSQITVKSKLSKDEQINAREVEILNSKIIRGIMKPTVEGEKKLSYLSPGGNKAGSLFKKRYNQKRFLFSYSTNIRGS